MGEKNDKMSRDVNFIPLLKQQHLNRCILNDDSNVRFVASSQSKQLRSHFPHLDSAAIHNRPTKTDMYMLHPISRPAKDIRA